MQKKFNICLIVLSALLVFGLFLSIFIFLYIFISGNYIDRDICVEKGCIEDFISVFGFSYSIFKSFFDVVVGAITAVGIYFAIKNYFLNSESTKMYNHIENLKLFNDFVDSELNKLNLVSPKSINHFKLYNSIYPQSKKGVLKKSIRYEAVVIKINDEIRKSNDDVKSYSEYDFKYKVHQDRLIKILFDIGIELSSGTRLEFYKIERQVYEFINIVNKEFLGDCLLINIHEIKYE